MSSWQLVAGTIGIMMWVLASTLWPAPPTMPPAYAADEAGATAIYEHWTPGDPLTVEPRSHRRVDIYGNEIEAAVSDYRVDPRGDIYERHSPQTALPRLGSPST